MGKSQMWLWTEVLSCLGYIKFLILSKVYGKKDNVWGVCMQERYLSVSEEKAKVFRST